MNDCFPHQEPPSVNDMLDNLKQKMCVDESRERFLRDSLETLTKLVSQTLEGNRYRRLLLGQKSVGKTTLLTQLKETVSENFLKS
jgi:stage III sporulation protein SpoIIIAA